MRVRIVKYRGFSTRYIAQRLERGFGAVGCEIVENCPDLSVVYYRWMRKDGPVTRPRAVWLVDEPYHWPHSRAWARGFDFVFVNDRVALDQQPSGFNVYWLPAAQEPIRVTQPITCDVAFVGAASPNRLRLLTQIRDRLWNLDVRLVGPGWPRAWGPRDEWITAEEAARYYAGARISLNIHRATRPGYQGSRPTGLNFRAFEIAAQGGFQILDEREDRGLFIPSAATFDGTAEGLLERISYYLDHEEERRASAEACRREVEAHTFAARARRILEAMSALPSAA